MKKNNRNKHQRYLQVKLKQHLAQRPQVIQSYGVTILQHVFDFVIQFKSQGKVTINVRQETQLPQRDSATLLTQLKSCQLLQKCTKNCNS